MPVPARIKRAIAFEFQTEMQRSFGVNFTVDVRDIEDPQRSGFYVRILKNDRPVESIPVYSIVDLRVGSWTARSVLKERQDDINNMLLDIVERYREQL